ncbi:hypothetical protein Ahy_A07g037191 [Arachis hypogaea]|uniref:SWIM-type domain-containing protein n=1 Tax=Arachis hypogaea TaxID=3818 RepID=A0A445CI40_ARAHY|nr:hypothetical protein Ahy_A07g037191 [Arachis hypogaea]
MKEVGQVAYRFLHVLPNGGFTNQLFWIDGDQHVRVMFDVYTPLMPQHVMDLYAAVRDIVVGGGPSPLTPEIVSFEATPIHYVQPHDIANENDSEGDSTYVTGSESSRDTTFEDEYVPETPSGGVGRFLLPPPLAITRLSDVPSHYQMLNLDAMQPNDLLNAGDGEDYNTNGESPPMIRVTHCDCRAFVFSVEELESTSYHVHLNAHTCDCGLFQSLHYPCRHSLRHVQLRASKGVILWTPCTRWPVFNVYEREFSPIPDEKLWPLWYNTQLKPNPAIRRKASRRPVSTRIRNEMDAIECAENRCGLCHGKGHTRCGYPNAPQSDS